MPNSWVADPEAVLDYEWDWTSWLDSANSETIATHAITADPGITVNSHTATGQTVTIWLTGGTTGSSYRITCHITTSAGRQDDRTISILVRER